MTNAWLQQQRKGALTEIADHVGLKNVERYKKIDLEVALEEHLRANSTKLSSDSKVAPFFSTVDPLSPVKQNPLTGTVQTAEKEKRPRARRQTLKAREELDGEEPTSSTSTALTKTPPTRAHHQSRTLPLPPSPSLLATQIETHTATLLTTLTTTIANSSLPTTLTSIRRALSSPTSLQLLTLFIEAWGLRTQVLPLRYLLTVPAIPLLGTPDLSLKAPDLFALLTAAFWGPVGLWAITSIALPLLGGWFINLKGEGGYDAVSFNTVKAVAAWVVYVRGGGPVESRRVVERGVPGGSVGMLVGAGVGTLAGVYEAVLRR